MTELRLAIGEAVVRGIGWQRLGTIFLSAPPERQTRLLPPVRAGRPA